MGGWVGYLNVNGGQRGKTEAGAAGLEGRNDLGDVIADEAKTVGGWVGGLDRGDRGGSNELL